MKQPQQLIGIIEREGSGYGALCPGLERFAMAYMAPGFPQGRESRLDGHARPRGHEGRLRRASRVLTRHRTLECNPL
jgi:hypothetical protein